jgi:hypothetical protein
MTFLLAAYNPRSLLENQLPLRNHLVPNGDGTADGVGAYSTPTLPPETMPGDCLRSVCALAAGAGSIDGLAGGELGSAIGEAP